MVAVTVRYALDLAPDILKFNLVTPLPGSKFYEDLEDKTAVDFSLLTPWTDLSGGPPPQSFSAVPVRTLLKYQRNGMMRHFSRPKILWRHLLLGTFRLRTIPFMFLLARNMLLGRIKHWLGR